MNRPLYLSCGHDGLRYGWSLTIRSCEIGAQCLLGDRPGPLDGLGWDPAPHRNHDTGCHEWYVFNLLSPINVPTNFLFMPCLSLWYCQLGLGLLWKLSWNGFVSKLQVTIYVWYQSIQINFMLITSASKSHLGYPWTVTSVSSVHVSKIKDRRQGLLEWVIRSQKKWRNPPSL